MAEENTTTPEQEKEATEQAEPSFQMVRAFFKDASLEMPHAPDIFFEDHDEQPTVDFKFGVAARPCFAPRLPSASKKRRCFWSKEASPVFSNLKTFRNRRLPMRRM